MTDLRKIGIKIGDDTLTAQKVAAAAFLASLGGALPSGDASAAFQKLCGEIAGDVMVENMPAFVGTTPSAPNAGDGLDYPEPSIVVQVDEDGNFVTVWWKHGDALTDWHEMGGGGAWEKVASDPSAGLARPVFTLVWQTSDDKPVALWVKYDTADTSWARIWPNSGGGSGTGGFVTAYAVDFRGLPAMSLNGASPPDYVIDGKTWTVVNQFTAAGQDWPRITGPSSPIADNGAIFWPDSTYTYPPILKTKLADLGLPALSTVEEFWVFVEILPPKGDDSNYGRVIMGVSSPVNSSGDADFQYRVQKTSYNNTVTSQTLGELHGAGATLNGRTIDREDTDTVMAIRVMPGCAEIYSGIASGTSSYLTGVSFEALRAQMHLLGRLIPTNAQVNVSLASAWAWSTDLYLFLTNKSNRVGLWDTPMTGSAWYRLRVDYLLVGGSGSGGGGGSSGADVPFHSIAITSGSLASIGTNRNLLVTGGGTLSGIDIADCVGGTVLMLTFAAATVVAAMGSPSVGAPIKTPRMGDVNPQDIHAQADDSVIVQLRTDSSTPFWKVIGGSFT